MVFFPAISVFAFYILVVTTVTNGSIALGLKILTNNCADRANGRGIKEDYACHFTSPYEYTKSASS